MKRFIQKHLNTRRKQFRFDRIASMLSDRFYNPGEGSQFALLGNAIPKSGTYLLNSLFSTLGGWINSRTHFLDHQLYGMNLDRDTTRFDIEPIESLDLLAPGSTAAAHLHFTARLASFFDNHPSIKHVFQYRDLRDVFVSYTNFYTRGKNVGHWDRPRRERDFYNEFFSNDSDRLAYTIPKLMENFNFEGYLPWLHDPNTFCIKFEDLYSELEALDSTGFGPVLKGLFDFLEVSTQNINPDQLKNSVLGKGYTESGTTKKIGQYKEVFEPCHYRLIDNKRFRDLMQNFGYEV